MKTSNLFKSKAKCPMCRSTNLILHELYSSYVDFYQLNGFVNMEDGYASGMGFADGVYANCIECDYKWRLRKTNQITDCFIDK